MEYLALNVRLKFYDENPNLVQEFHDVYKKHGMRPIFVHTVEKDVSYEDACVVNQKCFDERIEFEEWEHYRITWECDWISYVDTTPSISFNPEANKNLDRKYQMIREEMILFSADEVTDEVFSEILSLMFDLYKLKSVYSIEIQKEG